MNTRNALFAFILTLVAGCSSSSGGGDPSQNSSGIVGGQLDTGHTPVGLVIQPWATGGTASCTGTLIGPRTVLTARHCLENNTYAWFQLDKYAPAAQWFQSSSLVLHPTVDVALMLLKDQPYQVDGQGAKVSVTPMAVAVTGEEPLPGMGITLIGFGRTVHGVAGDKLKRFGTNSITTVFSDDFWFWGTSNLCEGDSGGPSTTTLYGGEKVIGVHSLRAGDCGTGGKDVRVDTVESWICQNAGDVPSCGCTAQSCDDGNPCTDDACDAATGKCKTTFNTLPCADDGDLCTQDVCAAGACTHPAAPDGTICDTGDLCDAAATCSKGTCVAGAKVKCDDSNPCTDDTCDAVKGCVYSPNTLSCADDGDACTSDVCTAGACTHPAAPDGTVCDSGDLCTAAGSCSQGACITGARVTCDDGNPCTDNACDSALGCVYTPNTLPCADDGNACTLDVCGAGACTHPAAPDGKPCNDGNLCTANETCQQGTCGAAMAVVCDDRDPCTVDTCNPLSGCSSSASPAGTACGQCLLCSLGGACVKDPTCGGAPAPDSGVVAGDSGLPAQDSGAASPDSVPPVGRDSGVKDDASRPDAKPPVTGGKADAGAGGDSGQGRADGSVVKKDLGRADAGAGNVSQDSGTWTEPDSGSGSAWGSLPDIYIGCSLSAAGARRDSGPVPPAGLLLLALALLRRRRKQS